MGENPPPAPASNTRSHLVRNFFRTLFVIALLSVLIVAVIFRRTTVSQYLWPEKNDGLKISLSEKPTRSWGPVIPITGKASQFCQVELFLDGKRINQTTSRDKETWSETGRVIERNFFEFEQVLLHPGKNSLLLRAQTVGGGSEPRGTDEVKTEIEWTPEDEDIEPVLFQPPKRTTAGVLHVRGAASPKTAVELNFYSLESVDAEPRKLPEDILVLTDENGLFEQDFTLPEPGLYLTYAHRPGSPGLYGRYHFDQLGTHFAPNTKSRVVFTVNYEEISIKVEEVLPRNDPALQELLNGHITFARFVENEFDLRLSGDQLAFDFLNTVPTISLDDQKAIIEATVKSNRTSVFPVRNGRLEITRGFSGQFPVSSSDESVEVVVHDYTVEGYSPVPTSIQNGTAVWTGDQSSLNANQSIQVSLAYNPTENPKSLLRLLTVSPYQLFGNRVWQFIAILFCLLYAIPLVWLSSLLREHPALFSSDAYMVRLKRCILLLLALVLVPGIEQAANVLTGIIRYWGFVQALTPGGNVSNNPLIFLASQLIIGLALLLVAQSFRLLIGNPRVDRWTKELSKGVGVALALSLAINGYYLVVFMFGRDRGETLIPATVAGFILLAFVGAIALSLLKPEFVGSLSLGRAALCLLVIGVLAYPANRNIYSVSGPGFSTWDVTYTNINYLFGIMQDFMPYLLLIGIAWLLKRASREGEEVQSFVVEMGLLVFSCYVIGTTANWFIIPIPFLLALWLYRYFLRDRYDRIELVSKLKPFVIAQRRWFLNRVFDLSLSQKLLGSVDQLEPKIVGGDLEIDEFLAQRNKLEVFDVSVKSQNAVYELPAKDVVLSVGPFASDWLNGLHALKRGLLISLPFLVLYLFTFLIGQIRLDRPFITLWTLLRIATFIADWGAFAFFFGYFFNQLKGESGLKKGLKTAVVVISCLLPVWLMSGASFVELSATFLRAGQIFLFFTVLGVWAFDYETFRGALRDQFSWKRFARFGDMPSFTAVGSVLFGSAGVAFSSVLNGKFLDLIAHLVSAIFPSLPNPLPK